MYIELVVGLLYSMYRMFVAYIVSLLLAIALGVSMARNRVLETVLLPVLDILQSIPILGFFPLALIVIIEHLPGGLGVETAVVFLLVTSLVWNMIFGVYSSVKALDPAIDDLVRVYRIGLSTRLFRIYVPASLRSIAANSIISWAGGWFFITSAEVITAAGGQYQVVGIGAEILRVFERGDYIGLLTGLLLMFSGIMATYIFLWNPIVSESTGRRLVSIDIFYTRLLKPLLREIWSLSIEAIEYIEYRARRVLGVSRVSLGPRGRLAIYTLLLVVLVVLASLYRKEILSEALYIVYSIISQSMTVLVNTLLTLSRVVGVVVLGVVVSILLAYTTIGSIERGVVRGAYIVLVGEVLASIPAIMWWPILYGLATGTSIGPYIVSLVVFLQGSMWYTYFNIILFGVSSIKRELLELSEIYGIRGPLFLRKIFVPAMLPAVASGGLSAWGGAWNASIVAEYISLGETTVDLGGVGALMNIYASRGMYRELLATVVILSLVIVVLNKTIWREVFRRVSRRYVVE